MTPEIIWQPGMPPNLLYVPLDLGVPEEAFEIMEREVLACPKIDWYADPKNGTWMYETRLTAFIIPLWTGSGIMDPTRRYEGANDFCHQTKEHFPETCRILRDYYLPLFDAEDNPRIVYTCSTKQHTWNIHSDALYQNRHKQAIKFRSVVHGPIDTLFFVDGDETHFPIPTDARSYIIDAAHPHGLKTDDTEKYTLGAGAPWTGKPSKRLLEVIEAGIATGKHWTADRIPRVLHENWQYY
jgi:hypothetical protein